MHTELGQRVLREHVAAIYFNYSATFIARFAFIGVVGAFMLLQLDEPLVLPFLVLHVLLYLHLCFMPRWTPEAPLGQSAFWARRITFVAAMLGFADGLAPWIFVPAGNLPATAVLMVVMMGNCARAVQSLRPVKAALFGHTLPMMGGLITALLWEGGGTHLFLAAFASVYLLMMLRVGVQEHRLLTESLMLRFEKESLALRLGEQIAATERASTEKSRFLATASHDLRQPLHAIALFGAALENALQGRPEGQNAQRLMLAVNALGSSLDSMLDVSRLDAGVVTPEVQPVQLDALFLPLNHMFSAQAEQRELQLRVRASRLWVRSDPQLLHRMLANLIDNALKYTAAGGVTVAARARGAQVWIEVRDTGMGIAQGQQERVFEEFYQVGNPGRDRSRGLGIGLAIVKRLSRLLDHPVQLHSRLGRGTRFRLLLPAAEAPAGAPVVPVPAEIGWQRRAMPAMPPLAGQVLLVDDEVEIRQAMRELLRAWGLEVCAAANEVEALEMLSPDRPIALLICDLRLAGGADGLALGQRLRQRFAPAAPLLLITGETAPERLQRVRASGVPVLFKPVEAGLLLRTLRELTATRRT
ncbi:hybrid sensor histidine kinase/response regulator [Variovorax sp. JS1663]|nr:hybrid sensor histidine kinase/response regulator [Variovorax sp. JS1663]OUL99281.1 hybrid sensor histidine kinase/response regulator [Variovorax sp. JS1663]